MPRSLAALLMTLVLSLAVVAQETKKGKEPEKDDSYIKLEARGKLVTGIKGVGGETTGIMIRTAVGSFELEMEKTLRDRAEKLNDKTVVVTGEIFVKPFGKGGARTIIKVGTLKEGK